MTNRGLCLCVLLASLAIADQDAALRAYQHGDFAKAIHEWRALATKGDPEAQFRLAAMYERGEGTRVQLDQAVSLYRKAAYQEHSHAQYALGRLYADGRGVSQDYVLANMWMFLASSTAGGEAAKDYEWLTAKMTPEQVTDAQRLVKDWEPAFPIGRDVSPPIIVSMVHPEYSAYKGTVVLDLIVDTAGKARDIRPQQPVHYDLDTKAIEAVSKWRFRPGSRNGRPVAVQSTITVNFR